MAGISDRDEIRDLHNPRNPLSRVQTADQLSVKTPPFLDPPGTHMEARSGTSSGMASAPQSGTQPSNPDILLCHGFTKQDAIVNVWGTTKDLQPWTKLVVRVLTLGSSLCFYRGRLIAVGGKDERRTTSYIFNEGTWKDYPDLRLGRRWAGVRVIGDLIVAIGGVCGIDGQPVANVEILDMSRDARVICWEAKAAQKYPSKWPILADDGRKYVYCVSGEDRMIEVYSVTGGWWSEPIQVPAEAGDLIGCSAVFVDGKLYLVGGKERACAIHDVTKNTWDYPASKPNSVHLFGSAIVSQGEILLFGGDGSDTIEKFQIKSHLWNTHRLQMPCEMSHHQVLLWHSR